MGFSSNLQGQAAHEALLSRQDSELRLLDTIRKSLLCKVKCDKEYSSALLTAVAQGQKIDGGDDVMGSGVTQSWKSLLEGFEFVGKLIKQNADLMENKVLDKLNQLYVDKRKTKKLYQDEHNRVSQQFTKFLGTMFQPLEEELDEELNVGRTLPEIKTQIMGYCD